MTKAAPLGRPSFPQSAKRSMVSRSDYEDSKRRRWKKSSGGRNAKNGNLRPRHMHPSNREGGVLVSAAPQPGLSQNTTRSVRVSLPTSFPMAEVADFIVRPDVVDWWLGVRARLPVQGYAVVPGAVSSGLQNVSNDYRVGEIIERQWHGDVRKLVVSVSGEQNAARTVSFQVTGRPGGSYVRIIERSVRDDDDARVSLRTWQRALNRLNELLRYVEQKQLRSRQALIVVHGIGEQLPGQTLREFTTAVFPKVDAAGRELSPSYVKPDYASKLFEMRTVSVPGDQAAGRPTTDVYELYWAHLIRDTTLMQVYGWALRLLLAPNCNLPQTLIAQVWTSRAIVVAGVAGAVILTATGAISALAAWLALGALAVLPAIGWFIFGVLQQKYVVDFAGDAARYLEPRPGNIQLRQAIREAGLDLLNALHDGGRYDRIIVFGHSLGSVIAYDILSYAWIRRARQHRSAPTMTMTSRRMIDVEDLLNPRPRARSLRTGQPDDTLAPDIEEVRRRQHAAWQEYRRNGFDWLVTDFITAGSPLAHARWLLNLDKRTSFDILVAERTFPTCPPQTENLRSPTPDRYRKAFTFTHAYPDPITGRSRSVQVPHHGGLFAITRWSNLYFPASGVLGGDPVGGPLQETFGKWIQDRPLEHPGGGFLGFAHTRYLSAAHKTAHIDVLRDALALSFRTKLSDVTFIEEERPPDVAT